jgi:hypothetical protein
VNFFNLLMVKLPFLSAALVLESWETGITRTNGGCADTWMRLRR